MLRIGLVGCGDISPMHLDAITADPDVTLVGVTDVDEGARTAAATAYGGTAFASLDELLDVGRLDVLHVCTPHYLHAPMAEQALAAGVNVLTEKPVARTLEEAAHLAEAAEASPAMLGVCFQNRYNNTVVDLKRRLDEGRYGDIVSVRGELRWHRDEAYYARRPWRRTWRQAGGGLLINQAIHTLDLMQWLAGGVVGVTGHAEQRAMRPPVEVEDTASIELRLATASGREVEGLFFGTNTHDDNAPVVVEVRTERAVLRLESDLTITEADGRVEVVAASGSGPEGRDYWGASHALLIADFYRHVRSGTPFWLDAAEATPALWILSEVYRQSGIDVDGEAAA